MYRLILLILVMLMPLSSAQAELLAFKDDSLAKIVEGHAG